MSLADRPRARDIGIAPGVFAPGRWNAITDIEGVAVGQLTLIEGENVRTGVTAVIPHPGNLFQEKVPSGFVVANGFGKFAGSTQVVELGEIETPILLTNTLSVAEAVAGVVEWTLGHAGNKRVKSINAVVGETNDGYLNDIRKRSVTIAHAVEAIDSARSGSVDEGCVGAGTGTRAFGWKGGVGTSSRRLPRELGGYTVGVFVQTNYGGMLSIMGVPIGQKLDRFYLKDGKTSEEAEYAADGSVIFVVATDAPLSDRNLRRLANRALLSVARTGSPIVNGSGDYAIAFSTAPEVRRSHTASAPRQIMDLPNELVSPLFQATIESAEEAVYNSIFRAHTTHGCGKQLDALPIDRVIELLDAHGARLGMSKR